MTGRGGPFFGTITAEQLFGYAERSERVFMEASSDLKCLLMSMDLHSTHSLYIVNWSRVPFFIRIVGSNDVLTGSSTSVALLLSSIPVICRFARLVNVSHVNRDSPGKATSTV